MFDFDKVSESDSERNNIMNDDWIDFFKIYIAVPKQLLGGVL